MTLLFYSFFANLPKFLRNQKIFCFIFYIFILFQFLSFTSNNKKKVKQVFTHSTFFDVLFIILRM